MITTKPIAGIQYASRVVRFKNGAQREVYVSPPVWSDIKQIADRANPEEFRLDGPVIVVNREEPATLEKGFVSFFQYLPF